MAASSTVAAAYERLTPWLDRCPPDVAGQRLWIRAEMVLCNQARQLGRTAEGERHARRALDAASRLGDTGLRGEALGQLGFFLTAPSQAAEAMALLSDAVSILRAAGERVTAAIFEGNLGMSLLSGGQPAEAIARFRVAAAALREAGRPLDAAMCEVNRGTAHLGAGEPEEALACARSALEPMVAAADFSGESYGRLLQGRAELALGLDATASLQRAVNLANRYGFRVVEGHAWRYRAVMDQLAGDLDGAASAYRRALALLPADDQSGRPAIAAWASAGGLDLGPILAGESRPLVWLDQRLLERLRRLIPD